MTTSFSNVTPGNFELSPCRVTYGGVDLGGTDKVSLKIEGSLAELKADQLGTGFVDKKSSGLKGSIETSLVETQYKDNWKVLFAPYKLVTQGGNKAFYFDSQVGQSMAALSKVLILHPLSKVDTDKSGDVYVWKAVAMPASNLDFSSSDQQKLKVTFEVYPDFTTQPPRYLIYGDPAVGLQDATAGAATAGTGNSGNGTVTSIVVTDNTLTETITLQCVTAVANGGVFNVQGSTSGPLGLATVGIGFSAPNNEIAFLINDGTNDFVVNDSFTIATTAANYS